MFQYPNSNEKKYMEIRKVWAGTRDTKINTSMVSDKPNLSTYSSLSSCCCMSLDDFAIVTSKEGRNISLYSTVYSNKQEKIKLVWTVLAPNISHREYARQYTSFF